MILIIYINKVSKCVNVCSVIAGGATALELAQVSHKTCAVLAFGAVGLKISHLRDKNVASVLNLMDAVATSSVMEVYAAHRIGLKNGPRLRKNESNDLFDLYLNTF